MNTFIYVYKTPDNKVLTKIKAKSLEQAQNYLKEI